MPMPMPMNSECGKQATGPCGRFAVANGPNSNHLPAATPSNVLRKKLWKGVMVLSNDRRSNRALPEEFAEYSVDGTADLCIFY